MTIEKEGVKSWDGKRPSSIAKALKAKQERIETLEKKLELEKEELTRWKDSSCRLEGNLNTALSTIETLESALKEMIDYWEMDETIVSEKEIFDMAKKALGGGA